MIEKMLVISTAHLPKQEIDLLNGRIISDEYNGWVRDEGTLVCGTVLNLDLSDLPRLKDLLKYTAKQRCEWLMFDRDAEVLKNHPSFDW